MAIACRDANPGQRSTHRSRIYSEGLANSGERISGFVEASRFLDMGRGESGIALWDTLPAHVFENSLTGDAVAPG